MKTITPPVQLPSPSRTVFGGMINLGYGQVENLAVADLGLINNVTGTMTGVELGFDQGFAAVAELEGEEVAALVEGAEE